ncbi:MAG: NUDIX hydrolase [Nitrospira sp.]|nr:NUDIX hydrolase [Nitrospira sp.]
MNYCSACGASLIVKIPEGDTLLRFVCERCHTVHYENPKIVVGCLPEWEDRILLCKRAIEPRSGLWTFPAGFMEQDETLEEAAARETLEEAEAEVEISRLYAVVSIPHVSQVYVVFRGTMKQAAFGPGAESLEVDLFKTEDIPWSKLAFRVIHEILERYCQDGTHAPVHVGTIMPSSQP